MNGTRTFYLLGSIVGTEIPYTNPPVAEIREKYCKNGVYSILSLDILERNPSTSFSELWDAVREKYSKLLTDVPAASNQGCPTVAYKLWQMGLIKSH